MTNSFPLFHGHHQNIEERREIPSSNSVSWRRYAVVFSLATLSLCMLVAITVMYGWLFDVRNLTQVQPEFVPMQFSTALSMVLCSLALLVQHFTSYSNFWRSISRCLSLLVILITGFTLIANFVNFDGFGIDKIFIKHALADTVGPLGHISRNAAVCLILVTLALLISSKQAKNLSLFFIAQACVISVFVLSTFAFIGYFTDIEQVYAWNTDDRMAILSSLSFMLLSLAHMPLIWLQLEQSVIKTQLLLPFTFLFLAIVFELSMPRGVSVGPVYAPFIIASVYMQRHASIILLTMLTTALLILGYFFSKDVGADPQISLTNRVLSIISMFFIAFCVFKIRKTLDELREQRQYNQFIVENTVDGIVTISQTGIVMSVNQATERMFGYSAEELEGQNIKILMPMKHQASHDGYLHNHMRGTDTHDVIGRVRTLQGLHKDKSLFDIEVSVSEINWKNQRVYTGIIRDVTERKKAENEIIRSHQELSRFAFIASHDLQEPLRKLVSFTGLLERQYQSVLEGPGLHYLNAISQSARRMKDMVHDIVVYSHVNANLDPTTSIDLNLIMKNVIETLSTSIAYKNAEVTWDRLPKIEANTAQMTQLLQNLISNGLKYNHQEHPPKIHVSAIKNQSEWLFSVQDNGIGIAEEFYTCIFQPFKKLHGQNKYPGSGIGLAICKKVVEQLDGRIWVESTPNRGSCFYWTVPMSQGEQ